MAEVILRRYYYRIECWASSAPCHSVNGWTHCVLCEVYSGMGVVGIQQLTVNGDKALQTAVNTLTCCQSRSVHKPSHECLFDTMCVCVCDCEQKTHLKPDMSIDGWMGGLLYWWIVFSSSFKHKPHYTLLDLYLYFFIIKHFSALLKNKVVKGGLLCHTRTIFDCSKNLQWSVIHFLIVWRTV